MCFEKINHNLPKKLIGEIFLFIMEKEDSIKIINASEGVSGEDELGSWRIFDDKKDTNVDPSHIFTTPDGRQIIPNRIYPVTSDNKNPETPLSDKKTIFPLQAIPLRINNPNKPPEPWKLSPHGTHQKR